MTAMYKTTRTIVLVIILLVLIICCKAQDYDRHTGCTNKPIKVFTDSSMFWKGVVWAMENKKTLVHDTVYLPIAKTISEWQTIPTLPIHHSYIPPTEYCSDTTPLYHAIKKQHEGQTD